MKYHIIFAIGFFLTIIPFIGVPTSWKLTSVGIIGAALMAAALIRYYTDYSSQEYGQTHADGGPENNNSQDAAIPDENTQEQKEEKEEVIKETVVVENTAQPSPYYNPEKTPERKIIRARRVKKVEVQDDEMNMDDQDDEEDDSYITKNKYEEEHSF